ncbi:MAG: hypothetical protein ACRDYX_08490 [Egibacteraceae bacterium]
MEPISPLQLHAAARIADALVWAAGLAGVVAGALLYRAGNLGFAIVAWVVTFIAGAALRLASWATKALAELLVRTERIEEELAKHARPERPGWH